MQRIYLSFYILLGLCNCLKSQDDWSLNAGLSYTNVIHSLNGQQIVYSHKPNSPFWNLGAQIGINKNFILNENTYLTSGIKLMLRGDKDSREILAPAMKTVSLRLIYLSVPASLNLRILNQKELFLKGGLSLDYLLIQNKIHEHLTYFPITGFLDKWELSSHLGFHFNVNEKMTVEILYLQGLTNIFSTSISGTNNRFTYKNQAFEGSIYYYL